MIKYFLYFSKIPEELTSKAEKLLEFVGLYQKRNLRAGDLSFGQQKLLELAMALMNEPKMLLLDEPTAGINPTIEPCSTFREIFSLALTPPKYL